MSEPEEKEDSADDAGPTLAHDLLQGSHLGDYVVQECIGSGGLGIVYSGVHPVIGKKVAIKVLQWEAARNPEDAARLKAEARLVNSIGHRGIVDIYDFGKTGDGREYVVMELLSGEPLDKVIADRAPLPVPEVLALLDEVCDALAAAHGAGVIHRDLKPNNVFYVAPPHGSRYIKLLDFGLAKKSTTPHGSSAQTRASSVVGTPYYMAPEQARALPVSPQTDLYSLGVMAFELLTGKLPFDAPTPFEVISLHLHAPPPSMLAIERSVPPALDKLVLKMLAKSSGDRPVSAASVRRDLQRIRNRLQTDATNVGGVPLPRAPKEEGAGCGEEQQEEVSPEGTTQPDMPAVGPSVQPAQLPEQGSPRQLSSRLARGHPSEDATPVAREAELFGAQSQIRACAFRRWESSQPMPRVAAPEPSPGPPPASRRPWRGWVTGLLAALASFGVGAWWLLSGTPSAPPALELQAPIEAPERPQVLTPVPSAPVAEPKPAAEAGLEPVGSRRADETPDGKGPKPASAGKRQVDLQAYRLQLLGRVDTLIATLESQSDKVELVSAGALRTRTSACSSLPECRESERQLKVLEARHR